MSVDGPGVAVEVSGGDPDPDEVAAIVAAVEAAWPRSSVGPAQAPPPRWRFSGRWWTKPVLARRDRP